MIPEYNRKVNAETGFSLYFSPKTLSRLKKLCDQQKPILIADEFTPYLAAVCVELNCPYFGSSTDLFRCKMSTVQLPTLFEHKFRITEKYNLTESSIGNIIGEIRKKLQMTDYVRCKKSELLSSVQTISKALANIDLLKFLELQHCNWQFIELFPCIPTKPYKIIHIGLMLDFNRTSEFISSAEMVYLY
jgi:hypothetical protein